MKHLAAVLVAAALPVTHAGAQALQREAQRAGVGLSAEPGSPYKGASLLFVERPPPRDYSINDKVTIIINESTRQTNQQKFDSKKSSSLSAELTQFPDLADLAEAELSNGNSSPVTGVAAKASSDFKGDGKLQRTDTITDRITATIIDVKPNGVLVIEARRHIAFNEDEQTVVLSGECRREDVTDANTVLSTQLAELKLVISREGQVSQSGRKGLLTRLFEAVFNF